MAGGPHSRRVDALPQPVPGSRIVDRIPVGRAVQPWPSRTVRYISRSWRGPLHLRVEGADVHLRYAAFHEHTATGAYPLHSHPYAEILLTLAGSGEVVTGRDPIRCEPGTTVVLPPRSPHGTRWRLRGGVWTVLVVDLDLDIDVGRLPLEESDPVDPAFSPFYERFFMRQLPEFRLRAVELRAAQRLADEMREILEGTPYGQGAEILAIVLRIVALLSRSLRAQGLASGRHIVPPRFSPESALLRARSQLERHIVFDPGVVGRLARSAGLSEEHFVRSFRDAFGATPKRYAQTLLMRRACGLLHATDLPVREIATRLGYGDASTFSRAFRRFTGVSPEPYRLRRHAEPAT